MREDAEADALEAIADEHASTAKALREDALRTEGMRAAFKAARERSVSSVLAILDRDVKAEKLDDDGEQLVKRYLVLALRALENAESGAENTRLHTLGRAAGAEQAGNIARKRAANARAAAEALRERIAAGESEDDARRPRPAPGLADARARIEEAAVAPEPKPAKRKRAARKKRARKADG